ncbi:MAG TPA: M50 family metallopeptidase [Candidatus Saccharimonadales bacterium]|nr:M50 family metallopeptidase [Candidatus Saccharimonadales bacterium]
MDIAIFILGILMLLGLIVAHEYGHAIAARRNGVEVEEFGVGFPPRAWGKKVKGTLYSINWLPLGGFVKLKGEHDAATGKGTYGGASLLAKTKILLAGVVVNWLIAVFIFTILSLVGMPKILPNQFAVSNDTYTSAGVVRAGEITKDSPAAKAGIVVGDQLLAFNGDPIPSAKRFAEQTAGAAGQTVPLAYKRNGQINTVYVTLNKDNSGGKGYVGIGPSEQSTQRATWSAPIVGAGLTVQFTYETFKGLGTTLADLFTGKFQKAGENVAGPIGIVNIMQQSSSLGLTPVLFLIGIISLTLAVMNVLPIPALDGGRLFVTLLFRALKKPLTKEREEAIQATGFVVLMILVLVITFVDVRRFF